MFHVKQLGHSDAKVMKTKGEVSHTELTRNQVRIVFSTICKHGDMWTQARRETEKKEIIWRGETEMLPTA